MKSTTDFAPGMRVNWRATVGGLRLTMVINAVVICSIPKEVLILFENRTGKFSIGHATPDQLIYPRRPGSPMSVPLDERADEMIAVQLEMGLDE